VRQLSTAGMVFFSARGDVMGIDDDRNLHVLIQRSTVTPSTCARIALTPGANTAWCRFSIERNS